MECSSSRAEILGCMVGLCSRCITEFAKERDSERLYNFGQCMGFADTSASQPYSSEVVPDCGHWEHMCTFVRPGVKDSLQVECQQSYSVNLLFGALSFGEKKPGYSSVQTAMIGVVDEQLPVERLWNNHPG